MVLQSFNTSMGIDIDRDRENRFGGLKLEKVV